MSLLETYETQYAALIADITAQIGRLQATQQLGRERRELCSKIDGNLGEAKDLLEQIGLEIRDLGVGQRPSATAKLNCAQVELQRLQGEYHNAKDLRRQLLGTSHTPLDGSTAVDDFYSGASLDEDETYVSTDQRQRLLDNSERIERSGNRLLEGYRIAIETESLGAQVLGDLHHQRETLEGARSRLHETNSDLGRASRTLNSMMLRALREKIVLYAMGFCFVVAVAVSLYLTFAPSSPQA